MRKNYITIIIAILVITAAIVSNVFAVETLYAEKSNTITNVKEMNGERIVSYGDYTDIAKDIYDIYKDFDEDKIKGNEITVNDLNNKNYVFCGAKGWQLPSEIIEKKVFGKSDIYRSSPIGITEDFNNRSEIYENLPATLVDIAGVYTSEDSQSKYLEDEYYSRVIRFKNQAGIFTAKAEDISAATTTDIDVFRQAAYLFAHEKDLGMHEIDYLQNAVWMLGKPINVGNLPKENLPSKEVYEKARKIVEESEAFLQNRKEVEAAGGYNPTAKDDSSTVAYSKENNTILVGPFSIDYIRNFINVDNKKVSFSGITDATLYDINGKEIDDNTWKFVYANKRQEVEGDEDYAFPRPNEEFYIQFSNENLTIDGIGNMKFKFEDMYADAEYYRFSGMWIQEIIWENSTNYDEETGLYTHMLYSTSKFDRDVYRPFQDIMVVQWAKIFYKDYELTIDFNDEKKFTIDLSGKVWEDIPLNKETTVDGVYSEDKEKLLKGIEVALYNKSNVNTPIQTTKTDKNGEYAFNDLPIDEYFVEFVYNGIKYEATDYLSKGSLVDYKKNPNNSIYTNNSKALESNRNEFNKKFEEITPGYTSTGIKLEYETVNGISTLITEKNGKLLEQYKMAARTYPNISYPISDNYIIDTQDKTIDGVKYIAIYPYMNNVNLGLKLRDKADLAIKNDTDKVTIIVKGQDPMTYGYPRRATEDVKFDISGRDAGYYTQVNEQEISKADYDWRYDSNSNYSGYYTKEDELQVFVQYKIIVKNQSQIATGCVTQLVDYFDDDFTYATQYSKYDGITSWVTVGDTSKIVEWYKADKQYSGYVGMYTNSLSDIYLQPGEAAYVYIVLQVNKDANGILMDEGKEGKKNVAEIIKYKITDIDKNCVGLIDHDSAPGNAIPGNVSTYEDDTDSAPLFKLVFDKNEGNVISGYVWEDNRTLTLSNLQKVGNGEKESIETLISNIRVELIEILEQEGKQTLEFVKDTVRTGEAGEYKFTNIETGNYKVRFVYGDYDQLQVSTKYNGQDYKATAYQKMIEDNNMKNVNKLQVVLTLDISGSMRGSKIENVKVAANNLIDELFDTYKDNIEIGLVVFDNKANVVSTMSNNKESIKNAINGLKVNGGTNIAEGINVTTSLFSGNANKVMVLFTDGQTKKEQDKNALINCSNAGILPISILTESSETVFGTQQNPTAGKVYKINEADIINVFEENVYEDILQNSKVIIRDTSYARDAQTNNDGEFNRANVINYSKVITKQNGSVLHAQNSSDIQELAEQTTMAAISDIVTIRPDKTTKVKELNLGLEERPKAELKVEQVVDSVKVILSDNKELINTQNSKIGVLSTPTTDVLHLDPEYMHGATIVITYKITVRNTGEVDTLANYFENSSDQIITNKVDKLYVYLKGNPVFRQDDNETTWNVVEDRSGLTAEAIRMIEDENIIVLSTDELNVELYPEITGKQSSVSTYLTVSKTITPEIMENEDLAYSSAAEIVQVSNILGRRDYNAIPGAGITQLDFTKARTIKISPPFGEGQIYYVLIATIIAMLGTGIYFIKKKVLY